MAINVAVAGSDHASPDRRSAFFRETVDRLRALPGVTSASAVNHVPLAGDLFRLGILIEGRPAPRPDEDSGAVYRVALPDYFRTMGMRLRRGRDFDARDTEGAPRVAVINETMARRFWPTRRPHRQTLPPRRPQGRVDDRHRRHRRPETVELVRSTR